MRVLVVALLLATTLAGCASETAPEEEADDEPGVVTDPNDYSYLDEGKDGSGWHVHDYWQGQTRMRLLEGQSGCQACSVTYGGDQGATLGRFRAEPDHVVPQGTAWVHVVATWEIEEGDHDGVGLYVKTANMTDFVFIDELEQGRTMTFNSTNDDNDPPHHRLSLWEFEVRALYGGGDGTSVSNFQVDVTIDVEQGLEIPPYPPHPDHWNGSDEILLHEQTREVIQDLDTPTISTCSGCLGYHPPEDGKIVPPSATAVEVELMVEDGLPATLDLYFHGGDTWEYVRAEPVEDGTDSKRWVLDVDGRPDSPYAKQSLWEFYIDNSQPTPAKYWEGTYHITIKAVK